MIIVSFVVQVFIQEKNEWMDYDLDCRTPEGAYGRAADLRKKDTLRKFRAAIRETQIIYREITIRDLT